jgi:sulfhydrogenase subunit beta (sulfur reductase)
MIKQSNENARLRFISKTGIEQLIAALRELGYCVVGPTLDQEAIVYSEIRSANDLPRGWSDSQQPGHYRLKSNDTDTYFAYNVGPQSWKQYFFPPRLAVAVAVRTDDGWNMSVPPRSDLKYALLGVRACELAAIAIQDRIFLHGPYVDQAYCDRRLSAFIIAVQCTQAASTCFCTSMGTGPCSKSGFDLAITEIAEGFTVEIGSALGAEVLQQMDHTAATPDQLQRAESQRQAAVQQISKRMDTTGVRDLLMQNLEHPRWDQVAQRCLSCTNCTMVCPTCFCSTVSEVTDLQGDRIERQRSWESCFSMDHSYTAGGTVRNDIRSRYRQWLTHKLATWHDQFDSSGCVGCGRCITWCPVGIDLTEEVAAIRSEPIQKRTLPVIQPSEAKVCRVARGGS